MAAAEKRKRIELLGLAEAKEILDLLGKVAAPPAPTATPDSVPEAFERIASVAGWLQHGRPNTRPEQVQGCHEIIQLCRKIEELLQEEMDFNVVSGSWASKKLYIISF